MKQRVGIIELIASTAAIRSKLCPSYWAELGLKRQFYSVMPQAVSVSRSRLPSHGARLPARPSRSCRSSVGVSGARDSRSFMSNPGGHGHG